MTIEELATIVQVAEQKTINAELKQRGYIDCKKHKEYKYIRIDVLFKGDLLETDTFPDAKRKRTYQGGIFTNVDGYQNLEFVIININDDKNTLPIDIQIWAKEL
jgi:hypothetical protein